MHTHREYRYRPAVGVVGRIHDKLIVERPRISPPRKADIPVDLLKDAAEVMTSFIGALGTFARGSPVFQFANC
jgi:hypothetical protein